MSIFIIKIVACITMLLDHVKYAIPQTEGLLTIYLGRMAFPLFAFLLTEGYTHTKDLKRYYKRLIIFALISQIPFMYFRMLVGEFIMLNVIFTLLLGLIAINIYDKIDKKYISIPIVIAIICLGEILRVDYGWYGVLLMFIIYLFRNRKIWMIISVILLNIVFYYTKVGMDIINFRYIIYLVFTSSPLIIILLYNGSLGRKMKYFFYWFYPIHLAMLYFINKMVILNLSFGDSLKILFEEIGKRI